MVTNYKPMRPGLEDVWNAFMCKGARYSHNDIPYCPTILSKLPQQIIHWEEAKTLHNRMIRKDENYSSDSFVCFYIDDQKFDGPRNSIWTYPERALNVLKHFRGIITPDFSTYQDFPYPIKINNTFRMRAFGYWAGVQGMEVINNVRWGTVETFHYCFDGIEKNSIVAIGTVGGSPRRIADRHRFEAGLNEMVNVLSPRTILVYGSSNYPCFDKLRSSGISVLSYKSATALYFEDRGQK